MIKNEKEKFECHLYCEMILNFYKETNIGTQEKPDWIWKSVWDIKEDEEQVYILLENSNNLFLSTYNKASKLSKVQKITFPDQEDSPCSLSIKQALLYLWRRKEFFKIQLIVLNSDNTVSLRKLSGRLINTFQYSQEKISRLYTNLGENSRGIIASLEGKTAKIIYFSNTFLIVPKLEAGRPYRLEFKGVTELKEVLIRKVSKHECQIIGLATKPNLFVLTTSLGGKSKKGRISLSSFYDWTKKSLFESSEINRSFLVLSPERQMHLEYELPRNIKINNKGDLALS